MQTLIYFLIMNTIKSFACQFLFFLIHFANLFFDADAGLKLNFFNYHFKYLPFTIPAEFNTRNSYFNPLQIQCQFINRFTQNGGETEKWSGWQLPGIITRMYIDHLAISRDHCYRFPAFSPFDRVQLPTRRNIEWTGQSHCLLPQR